MKHCICRFAHCLVCLCLALSMNSCAQSDVETATAVIDAASSIPVVDQAYRDIPGPGVAQAVAIGATTTQAAQTYQGLPNAGQVAQVYQGFPDTGPGAGDGRAAALAAATTQMGQGYQEPPGPSANDDRMAALEAAAAQHPRAAYDLALRYFRGDGVERDSYRALSWMRAAAEGGDFNAQKALGRLYLTGLEEMGSDPREARTWLSLAASRGDKESAKLLAEAEAAARSDEQEYKWLNRWRPVTYNWWRSGYSYYGYWNGHAWNY